MALNRFLVPATLVFMSGALQANSIEDFYTHFKNGHYPKAIESLEGLEIQNDTHGSKPYLLGLSYSRLQEYDKASAQFAIAVQEKNDSADLYYEYGQALYANNELKKARTAFKTSADKKFNRPASLYYVAHISQILEEFEMARDYYVLTLKDKASDTKMKQVAHFQLAETLLSMAREKSKNPEELTKRVDKFVLPMMTKAHDLDKSSPVATEVKERSAQLMQEFNLDPNMLVNGRRVDAKRYGGYVSQKIRFDDNILLTNEENNLQQSRKESYIFETEAYANYDFILKKRYIVSPEARFTFTQHSDQSTPEVYQNDSLVMNFSLKNKYEHKVKELPASFLFDIDYGNTMKDWKAQKKKEYYASSLTFTVGESFSFFSIGDTTVRLKRKNYTGENEAISNHTTTLNADQTFFMPRQHLMVALFEASFIDNYNSSSTNTNTYLLRADYIIPQIMPYYTLDLALAATLTDTLEQESSRGTEISWNPSIDLSKELSESVKVSLNYDFTKSKSKDSNYSYSKHMLTTEFRYAF